MAPSRLVALAALGLDVGVVLAVGERGVAALARIAQAQVDDAGDGVRAVLRRGAVAQHFDGFDRGERNGVQVDGGRAAADRAVDVHQRGLVAALAVDQHQRLVGREAAQRGGADVIGAVGDRRAREVERGRRGRQRLGELGGALRAQGFGGQHVDGREGIEARARRRRACR